MDALETEMAGSSATGAPPARRGVVRQSVVVPDSRLGVGRLLVGEPRAALRRRVAAFRLRWGAPAGTRRRPAGPAPTRAVLVCSPGGHFQQMLALRPVWGDLAVTWATLPSPDVEHLLVTEDVCLAHGPTNRSLPNLIRNFAVAWRTLRSRQPDVILSTGAGLAVPFFWVGWLLGLRLVYVESLARVDRPSLSGRMVQPVADAMFVQWPQAASGKFRHVGSLL